MQIRPNCSSFVPQGSGQNSMAFSRHIFWIRVSHQPPQFKYLSNVWWTLQFQTTYIENMPLLFLPYPWSSAYSPVLIPLSVPETTATAIVSTILGYCNSLLYNNAKQDYSKTSACLSNGSHAFSSFFSLSAASKIIALAPCALSHHFQNVYNNLSSTLIHITSLSKCNINSSKKFQTATLNQ